MVLHLFWIKVQISCFECSIKFSVKFHSYHLILMLITIFPILSKFLKHLIDSILFQVPIILEKLYLSRQLPKWFIYLNVDCQFVVTLSSPILLTIYFFLLIKHHNKQNIVQVILKINLLVWILFFKKYKKKFVFFLMNF